MSTQMSKIQDKIKELLKEQEQLKPMLKDEFFNMLESSGGLMLDSRLFAGLVAYASNPDNKTSPFLKELYELGSKKIPSKKQAIKEAKVDNRTNKVQSNANQETEIL